MTDALLDLMYPVRVAEATDAWIPDAVDAAEAQLSGSFLSRIAHAATSPFRAAANIATTAIETPFNVATRIAQTPFALAARAANKLPSMPGSGPSASSAPAPDAGPQIPDGSSPDGGGDDAMPDTSGFPLFFQQHPHQHHPHHHHFRHLARAHAMMGLGVPDWLQRLNPFASKPSAGKLLVSAVPGGVAASEAHAIASKALKDGSLNPAHLKKAGNLARAARSGHKGSIAKIALLKHKAGQGDPHAEVAMDRLRLADTIQRGGRLEQSTTSLRHLRNAGLATLKA